MTGYQPAAGFAAAGLAVLLAAATVRAADDGKPAPNLPAPGEARAQEQLPEAPPEKMLKVPPPPGQKIEPGSADGSGSGSGEGEPAKAPPAR